MQVVPGPALGCCATGPGVVKVLAIGMLLGYLLSRALEQGTPPTRVIRLVVHEGERERNNEAR